MRGSCVPNFEAIDTMEVAAEHFDTLDKRSSSDIFKTAGPRDLGPIIRNVDLEKPLPLRKSKQP